MILSYDSEPWDHVVGIDPGETTGIWAVKLGAGRTLSSRLDGGAVFGGQLNVQALSTRYEWFAKEAQFVRSLHGRLVSLAEQWDVSECLHLAIEDFVVRERSMDRSLLSPVRLTAGLLALLEQEDELNVVVHLNSASDAKSTISDKTLKRLGVYRAGQPHQMDAARHALLVLRKEQT